MTGSSQTVASIGADIASMVSSRMIREKPLANREETVDE
jgi:hypothetical protein